jgi:hypothetical protein
MVTCLLESLLENAVKIADEQIQDFRETEEMLTTVESLCGPYVWGDYDILVLPPSFPFGS